MATLAVITNRSSTRNLREAGWIDSMIASEPVAHIQVDNGADILYAVRQCAAVEATTIVVNGGDGTVGLVFGALAEDKPFSQMPALALLPGGRTNMTAEGVSLQGDARAAFARLLFHWRNQTLDQHLVSRPVLRLRRGETAPLYGTFFGAAEVVDGILFCRRHLYPLGLPNSISHALALSMTLGRGLFGTGPAEKTHVQGINGDEAGHYFLVAVTSLDQLMFGLRPMPDNTDGPLHVLRVGHGMRPLLNIVPDVLRRRLGSGPGRDVQRTSNVTLRFSGAYTLDGELYEAHTQTPLALDAGPTMRFVRFTTP